MNKLLSNFYEKSSYFLLFLIVILFPINQQLHLRPFPNVEGVIIDYLMVKISIPEVLLIFFTFFNIRNIYNYWTSFLNSFPRKVLSLLLLSPVIISIYFSNYLALSVYENLILLFFVLNIPTIKDYPKVNFDYLFIVSIKFWMSVLLLLGFLQFIFQESVLDSYYYFGEFTYTSDNYHIKQDGSLLKNMIPAYGIFSHSNIYGAFFLITTMFLMIKKKAPLVFILIGFFGVLLSGSTNILVAFLLFQVFYFFKLKDYFLLAYPLILLISLNILSLNFSSYVEDSSIYRRLYMTELSNRYFLQNPFEFLFGFGYFNYFKIVAEDLYFYEIIRFFQPPHISLYLLIWQYGFLFLLLIFLLLKKIYKEISREFKIFYIVLLSISMLDHFIVTNHQIKMLLFLIIPYSIYRASSIKIK